jgi:hypothetical protein
MCFNYFYSPNATLCSAFSRKKRKKKIPPNFFFLISIRHAARIFAFYSASRIVHIVKFSCVGKKVSIEFFHLVKVEKRTQGHQRSGGRWFWFKLHHLNNQKTPNNCKFYQSVNGRGEFGKFVILSGCLQPKNQPIWAKWMVRVL